MKKSKVFISLLCAMALVLGSIPAIGFAEEGEITVMVDGVTLDPAEGRAQIVGAGTTMVPFRAIFEALGFEVGYYPNVGRVTTVFGYNEEKNTVIGMVIGSVNVYKCDYFSEMKDEQNKLNYEELLTVLLGSPCEEKAAEEAFINEEGRTLVPPRAIVEALGGQVWWAAESKTVVIKTYSYCYAGTDIPSYESVMKDAGYEEGYISAADGVYTYAYPDIASKFNEIYQEALAESGINFTDGNDDDDNKQTALYESQKNNYLLLQASIGDDKLYMTPYSNQEHYIIGLSGTEVNVTDIPCYTYITGSECLSWEEDANGNHVYCYVYDDEEAGDYFKALTEKGFQCYKSGERYVCFNCGNSFVTVEMSEDGNVYITPSVAAAPISQEQYEYEEECYFLTDIPTVKSVMAIGATEVRYNEEYNNFDYIYACGEEVVSEYLVELQRGGIEVVYAEDGGIWAESGTNKYIEILFAAEGVSITPCVKAETYIGTSVPSYSYVTGGECVSSYSEEGKKHYRYQYSEEELNKYEDYLTAEGFEKADDSFMAWRSDGVMVEISEKTVGEICYVEIVLSNEEALEERTQ